MGSANPRGIEQNEVTWWSLWTDVRWLGSESYVILSSEFAEDFFNRAGYLDCGGTHESVAKAEAEFAEVGRRPLFCVQEGCQALLEELASRGYSETDCMSVMQLERSRFRRSEDLAIVPRSGYTALEWAEVYSMSFYGDARVVGAVTRVLSAIGTHPAVTLLAAKESGRFAGVLAAFRTPGLLGVYCVGTRKEFRGVGIASSLISETENIAAKEGRKLVLQTILSDKVEDFYRRGGFRRLYVKRFLGGGGPATGRRSREAN